uniref:Uncharacterized protein n=1 Tax=Glossina palpalis gambiensis TaxID=67801 RepID=A0A1B0B2K6_9MUSC
MSMSEYSIVSQNTFDFEIFLGGSIRPNKGWKAEHKAARTLGIIMGLRIACIIYHYLPTLLVAYSSISSLHHRVANIFVFAKTAGVGFITVDSSLR